MEEYIIMPKTLPQPTLDSIDLTAVLSALADPVRRYLLREVTKNNSALECGALSQDLDLTSATLSHHWRVLREAGLTTTTIHGRSRLIGIRKEDLEKRFPLLLDAVLLAKEPTSQLMLKGIVK